MQKSKCSFCKKPLDGLGHKCKFCGKVHCSKHILPEDHKCKGLNKHKKEKQEAWKISSSELKKSQTKERDYGWGSNVSAEDLFGGVEEKLPRKRKRINPFKNTSLMDILFFLSLTLLLLSFVGQLFLFSDVPIEQDMQFSVGNPKAIYFYDIDSSCNIQEESSIKSSIDYLSSGTGVQFIKTVTPLALIIGGISYNCENSMSTYNAVGEAESGYIAGVAGVPFLIIWNKISLLSTEREVIIHETLHSMGFDHSSKSTSVMYPYTNGISLDEETKKFVNDAYLHPVSYFNVIPFNLLLVLTIILFFLRLKDD